MEKFLESLQEAEKSLKNTDHMVYVTFPLIKDKRILLKAIEEMKDSISNCIKAILHYEYLYKRITLYKDPKSNFRTFVEECAPRYNIKGDEIESILEVFDFAEKHSKSPFEFVKEEKVIILSKNMEPKTLTLEQTKELLLVSKNILKKTKEKILDNYP